MSNATKLIIFQLHRLGNEFSRKYAKDYRFSRNSAKIF